MSRYIDADALLEDWGIDIEPIKRRPIQMDEFRDFMRRYENHPYYFAILAVALTTTADVVEVGRCGECRFTDGIGAIADGRHWCVLHGSFMYYCSDFEREVEDE